MKKNETVMGSVRSEQRFDELKQLGLSPFQLDLNQSSVIQNEIVHFTKHLVISLPPLFRDTPEKYRAALTELLDRFPKETRIIFTSSTGIYPQEAGNFDENFVFNSEQDSTILNIAEQVVRQSQKPHILFRLGGLIGPNRHPIRFLQGRKEVKNPNGLINFVHQGDCIRAIIKAIQNPELAGTFNLVYPDRPTRKKYYSKAAEFYQFPPPEFKDEAPTQRTIISDKFTQLSGFNYEFPIDVFPKLELS